MLYTTHEVIRSTGKGRHSEKRRMTQRDKFRMTKGRWIERRDSPENTYTGAAQSLHGAKVGREGGTKKKKLEETQRHSKE